MVAISLLEAAKLAVGQGQTLRAGMIMTFSEASPLLRAIPYQTISGNAIQYNLTGALPGIAFRGINESYTPTVGVINPQTEALKVIGGELTVDTAIIKSQGSDVRANHEKLQATALAQQLGYTMIKGNSETQVREFDGLERRLTGGQVISNSAASGGAGLSMNVLDQALDQTEGGTHLLMTKQTRRRLTAYLRDSPSIQTSRDEFGRQVMTYYDHEILLADEFGDTPAITETETYTGGGTADGTSIYVLRLEEGYLNAIQNGSMEVTDLGTLQATPAVGTRVEWLVGLCLYHPRAATRVRDIDAAVVAID